MRLRPSLRVLDRGPTSLQFGTDPRWAHTLTGLAPHEHALLQTLGHVERPTTGALLARSAGHSPVRLAALLDELAESDLLEQVPGRSTRRVDSRLLDDAAAISAAVHDTDGTRTVADRVSRTVGVSGAGRLGMVVATTLASAGVGVLLVDDARPVRPADVGVGGFRDPDVGMRRDRAATEVITRAAPAVRVGRADDDAPDVVVIVFEDVADPMRTARLMSQGVPHLTVVVREGDVVVGPFTDPGRSACLSCLDLHRADVDPAWVDVAPQLRRAGRLWPAAIDSVLSALAGALAAAQVLAHLDGFSPATAGASIELSLPDALPRLRTWPVHPGCGCTDFSAR